MLYILSRPPFKQKMITFEVSWTADAMEIVTMTTTNLSCVLNGTLLKGFLNKNVILFQKSSQFSFVRKRMQHVTFCKIS